MSGKVAQPSFQFTSSMAATIQDLNLDQEKEFEGRRTYTGTVAVPSVSFRIAVTGIDEQGFRFQRVQNHLFSTKR